MVVHLGSSIKTYRDLSRRWTPPGCALGDGDAVNLHDAYPHWAGPGQREPISVFRFRGRHCRRVFAVLPDLLLPGCSHPAEVRDRAVTAYVSGQGTYEAIATEAGVAKSTVWRWVHEAGRRSEAWLERVRTLLRQLGLPDGPVTYRHDLRPLFLRRRVRRPGMLEALLLLEALLEWVERLRQGLLRLGRGPLPAGLHAFGWHVLTHLGISGARAGP